MLPKAFFTSMDARALSGRSRAAARMDSTSAAAPPALPHPYFPTARWMSPSKTSIPEPIANLSNASLHTTGLNPTPFVLQNGRRRAPVHNCTTPVGMQAAPHKAAHSASNLGPSACACIASMSVFLVPLGPGPAAGLSRAQRREAIPAVGRTLDRSGTCKAAALSNISCSSGLNGSVLNRAATEASVSGPGGTGGPSTSIAPAPRTHPWLALMDAALASAGSRWASGSVALDSCGRTAEDLATSRSSIKSLTSLIHSPASAIFKRSLIASVVGDGVFGWVSRLRPTSSWRAGRKNNCDSARSNLCASSWTFPRAPVLVEVIAPANKRNPTMPTRATSLRGIHITGADGKASGNSRSIRNNATSASAFGCDARECSSRLPRSSGLWPLRIARRTAEVQLLHTIP
mmetsp:Transcript_114646/g.286590  ORF Transcript_114646/g.286590 Transcript_114646/m.286590 type:complete len:403 (-) Transcript_114646:115-1323(-)